MKTDKTKERLKKRNEKITAEFLKLKDNKKNGIQVYTDKHIYDRLATKYFLAAKTIENIIFGRV